MTILTIDTSPDELADTHTREALRSMYLHRRNWLAEAHERHAPKVVIRWLTELVANASLALQKKDRTP